jgi:hypothetical protein
MRFALGLAYLVSQIPVIGHLLGDLDLHRRDNGLPELQLPASGFQLRRCICPNDAARGGLQGGHAP